MRIKWEKKEKMMLMNNEMKKCINCGFNINFPQSVNSICETCFPICYLKLKPIILSNDLMLPHEMFDYTDSDISDDDTFMCEKCNDQPKDLNSCFCRLCIDYFRNPSKCQKCNKVISERNPLQSKTCNTCMIDMARYLY